MKYILLIWIFLLLGCRGTEVEMALPYAGDKLVLSGHLQAGQPIRIQVNRTFPPVGKVPADVSVINARVILYKNKKEYATLLPSEERGIYRSDSLVEAGQNYVVQVRAEGFPIAESEPIHVPESPPAVTFTRERDVPGIINPSTPQDLIRVYFTDAPQRQQEYYFISFLSYYPSRTWRAYWPAVDNVATNEEDCHTSAGETVNGNEYLLRLLAGKCLPDAGVPLKFSVETGIINNNGMREKAYKVEMRIGTINKEWFTQAKIDSQQPEGLDLLVMAPRTTYSNIKNGYGLIYASNETTIELK